MSHVPEPRDAPFRHVCDLCGAFSSVARGTACTTCGTGTMRFLSELQLIRDERRRARLHAHAA